MLAGRLLAIAGLVGIFMLTIASVSWGDVAVGLVLAGLVELGHRYRVARGGRIGTGQDDGIERPPLWRRLIAVPPLALAVAREITVGTWNVAQFSLGLRPVTDAGVVEVELEGISREGVALWAFITTISPGEIVVEADAERGRLLIHTLDAADPAAIRAHHRHIYERYQRKVVP